MEMVSTTEVILVGLGYMVISVCAGLTLSGYLRSRRKEVSDVKLDLTTADTRARLTVFLANHGITGDADIRRGIVFAPVPPDRLTLLADTLNKAHAIYATMRNRNADGLYLYDVANKTYRSIPVDMTDLLEAGRVMSRVAEDRRKSRSLYKGMTEQEVKQLVRAGMSQWLKDDGYPEQARQAMEGKFDENPDFKAARHVLELAFKVKAAGID